MSALASILLTAAGELAVPVIRKLLNESIGNAGGDITGKVIDIIAAKAGVTPDRLPDVPAPDLQDAIVAAEPEAADILIKHVESQRLINEAVKAELDKGGPTWTWGWRPGWMWLLAFVWLYALILRPLANAAFGAAIEAVDLTILMTLTGVFTGLYMGGHTAKSIISGLRRHPYD
ncbi:hypothetical protein ASD64_19270 [Mesorhizobium sp. Root157]|uniref:3TM-type holin n=1 Tax=Mesorhizobium sp. Root157 TaxID=1736477 RepID=UPI0006F533CE|nr:3TM-type holin [Mesorhizobium sp. Root157]KQZ92789.1 hypothetical protein ASD64_19270 [Mesorhizobium sp. Root157]